MDLGLEDKVALICGASAGLGRATAERFAAERARVVICSRNPAKLKSAAAEIASSVSKQFGFEPTIVSIPANLASRDDIDKLVDATVARFGTIHILFTNTGGPPAGTFFDFEDDDWQRAFEQLLLFVIRIIRKVVPIMKEQRFGRIINNTSITVKQPASDLILSNVFRTAVVSLAKTLATDLARYNILINNVCPGFHLTQRSEELIGRRARLSQRSHAQVLEELTSNIPLRRVGRPEELASLVAFLASDGASNITGATVQVDGGAIRSLF